MLANTISKNRKSICEDKKHRYQLAEPKPYVKSLYITKLAITLDAAKCDLFGAFKKQHKQVAADMTKAQGKRAASSVAATRVVNKVLKLRKQYGGVLLKALRGISKLTIAHESDFGEALHSVHNEPFFYESAYNFVSRPLVMSLDSCGRYRPGDEVDEAVPTTWKCSDKCKTNQT